MLWVRLSVLVLLVAVVSAGMVAMRDRGPGKPVATKYGVTSQGREFAVKVDGDGQPVAFSSEIAALCPSGRMASMPWSPSEADGVPFHRAGDKLTVAERGELWELELDGTVAKDGALRGTMSLVLHVKPKTRAPYDCTSPRVRVSAGR